MLVHVSTVDMEAEIVNDFQTKTVDVDQENIGLE